MASVLLCVYCPLYVHVAYYTRAYSPHPLSAHTRCTSVCLCCICVCAGVCVLTLAVQLHNLTSQPQEVQLSVQEAQGFVFAGSKQQVVNVLPRTTHDVSWTLVAHASGQLQLPVVRVTSSKLGCGVNTQGAPIHVMPY